MIEAFEPPTYLAWRWVTDAGTDLDSALATLVELRLTRREDGGTILDLRESGFAHEKNRQENDGGWDHELGRLVDYLAT